MATLSNILIGALSILITFGLAVFVHEFGHMIFALIRGVGVESFAIGMGPKITEWKWRGIEFSLRWLPVGGFVKLHGMVAEDEEDADSSSEPADKAEETPMGEMGDGETTTGADARQDGETGEEKQKDLTEASYDDLMALQGKGLITKIMVFGGGVFMNFVTAILATALLLFIGQEISRVRFVLDTVKPDSVAAQAGFQAGDEVVAANGQPLEFVDQFSDEWETLWGDAPGPEGERTVNLDLTVKGESGAEREIVLNNMTPDKLDELFEDIDLVIPPVVGGVVFHQPADRAGLKEDDLVKAIDGQPMHSFQEMSKIIKKSIDKPLIFTIDRDGQIMELEVTPKPDVMDKEVGAIGITSGSREKVYDRVSNPFKALAVAPMLTINRVALIINLNKEFFVKASFQDVRENVGGPVAIAAMTVRAAHRGFAGALDWFILLNLLLMIFNLLPLPVLDGGFILLAFIESIIRRPVPAKVLGPIYSVFVVFLIVLMALITFQDVLNLFSKG